MTLAAPIPPRRRAGPPLAWIALRGAWESRAVVRDARFATLLQPPAESASSPRSVDDAARATRVAFHALRLLARLPRAGWRDTCLFRSISECLVLRMLGHPAMVKLGVRVGGSDAVSAHAWTECAGVACLATPNDADDPYTPLR